MRNLKRALSLALASVMVLGLMVVGTSAVSYSDVSDENNVEAIEVLQSVGIMEGTGDGAFSPDGQFTRNEMAVIMSNLMKYNVATYKNTAPFADVPEWAEPYVAACYTNGITSGIGNGLYGGSNTVTTAEAALMLLKAIGYFQYQEDFGDDWQLSTIAQGNRTDLFVGVDSGARDVITRDDVAQLVLNALETGTVEPDGSRLEINTGDVSISQKGNYNYVTSREKYAVAIKAEAFGGGAGATSGQNLNAPIVELGEKLYMGDLQRDIQPNEFGAPSTVWSYRNREIGTYEDEPDYTWSKKVTSRTLYGAMGREAMEYDWLVKVDGEEVTGVNGDAVMENRVMDNDCFFKDINGTAETGNGTMTRVYLDAQEKEAYISVIHVYASEVTGCDANSDGTYEIRLADEGVTYDSEVPYDIDDVVLYTKLIDDLGDENGSCLEIKSMQEAEEITGELTRIRDTDNSFVTNGDTYTYSMKTRTDKLRNSSVGQDVRFFMDQFGYAIWLEEVENHNYALVTACNSGTDWRDDYQVKLLFPDGTIKTVSLTNTSDGYGENDSERIAGKIVSYSVNSKGEYKLKVESVGWKDEQTTAKTPAMNTDDTDHINEEAGIDVENGKANVVFANPDGVRYAANDNTVFFVYDAGSDKYSAYVGFKNVPDMSTSATDKANEDWAVSIALDGSATIRNNIVNAVFIWNKGNVVGGSDIDLFLWLNDKKVTSDSEWGDYRSVPAVINGEMKNVLISEDEYGALVASAHEQCPYDLGVIVKNATFDENDILTYGSAAARGDSVNPTTGDGYLVGTYKVAKNRLSILRFENLDEDADDAAGYYNSFSFADSVKVYEWSARNGKFISKTITALQNGDYNVYVKIDDGQITAIYYTSYDNNAKTNDDGNLVPDAKLDFAVEHPDYATYRNDGFIS